MHPADRQEEMGHFTAWVRGSDQMRTRYYLTLAKRRAYRSLHLVPTALQGLGQMIRTDSFQQKDLFLTSESVARLD